MATVGAVAVLRCCTALGQGRGFELVKCLLRSPCLLPPPTNLPRFHPVCLRPTRSASGPAPSGPCGAPHWTNDMDARGQGCLACLGRWQTGWKRPTPATTNPRPRTGPPPSRSRSAPAGGIPSDSSPVGVCGRARLMPPWAYPHVGARRRSARGAGRRQERRAQRSREARPAKRSAAGCLDEVEKLVPHLMASRRRARRVPRVPAKQSARLRAR